MNLYLEDRFFLCLGIDHEEFEGVLFHISVQHIEPSRINNHGGMTDRIYSSLFKAVAGY
jgi:hypothetical protein